jgi:outer membrane protein assembly factor BamE (lipoprotein component of BamABCDE complex)
MKNKILGWLGVIYLMAGCSPIIHMRGNLPHDEELNKVQAGVHTKGDVLKILGEPSIPELFEGKGWFYIGERTQEVSFLRPKVLTRRVTLIEFDDKDMVSSITTHDEKAGMDIEVSKRETPTLGRDPSIFREIFGNIGKYDHAKHQGGYTAKS